MPDPYADRMGDWIQCYSGTVFFPLDPRPDEIHIEDIARALSMQCRYSGHVRKFYSVAEHCVHVSRVVSPEHALWGLLHDASEAYLVDVPRPIKPMLPQYQAMEARLMSAICERFTIDRQAPHAVKVADNRMLATEKAVLLGPCEREWADTGPPHPDVSIQCWLPERAYQHFMHRFRLLWGNHLSNLLSDARLAVGVAEANER